MKWTNELPIEYIGHREALCDKCKKTIIPSEGFFHCHEPNCEQDYHSKWCKKEDKIKF